MERQLAATLDAEVTHAAGLAEAEVMRMVEDLRAGLDAHPGSDYRRSLEEWKRSTRLVSVPFMLSPRYGVLWPRVDATLDPEQKRFLRENGDFLSDKTATMVLQNIALRYQTEILAETGAAKKNAADASANAALASANAAPAKPMGVSTRSAGASAKGAAEPEAFDDAVARADAERSTPREPASLAPAASSGKLAAGEETFAQSQASSARQMALDAFAQNPALQSKVYEEAREKGDMVSSRNVAPMAASVPNSMSQSSASTAEAAPVLSSAAPAPLQKDKEDDRTRGALRREPEPQAPAQKAPREQTTVRAEQSAARKEAPSQFVVTSQLLSQIASRGDHGLIPRFIGERLVFLFWERQKDGGIAGCEIATPAFRARIAGVLTATYTPVRILTLLDETGTPVAAPPDTPARDWRRPFVAREIGESLPRWEAAAYLTDPQAIAARARSSSLVIWIMVMILFVSVAGGGTMVLSSVYGEMRLAQQKATFVANVSHELKTPLTSISLFVDLMRRKAPLPQAKKEQYLSLIASETERLTRLINNVLDFSRGRAGVRYAKQRIDAAEVTAQVVEGQRVHLESRGFSLSLAAAGTAMVLADPEALKQVLLNLLSNAEKYSAEKKEITIDIGREPGAGGDAAGTVAIRVRDRGIGVAQKDRERIFREFYRVDDSLSSGVQGTGLGLTIARRIIRDHGGDITCAAREGGGTDFLVRLPLDDGGETGT